MKSYTNNLTPKYRLEQDVHSKNNQYKISIVRVYKEFLQISIKLSVVFSLYSPEAGV